MPSHPWATCIPLGPQLPVNISMLEPPGHPPPNGPVLSLQWGSHLPTHRRGSLMSGVYNSLVNRPRVALLGDAQLAPHRVSHSRHPPRASVHVDGLPDTMRMLNYVDSSSPPPRAPTALVSMTLCSPQYSIRMHGNVTQLGKLSTTIVSPPGPTSTHLFGNRRHRRWQTRHPGGAPLRAIK